MSGFYQYDTRGISQASQIVNLERMVEKRNTQIEKLQAELATALELLHEANVDWVPHTSNLSAAIVDFLRRKESK